MYTETELIAEVKRACQTMQNHSNLNEVRVVIDDNQVLDSEKLTAALGPGFDGFSVGDNESLDKFTPRALVIQRKLKFKAAAQTDTQIAMPQYVCHKKVYALKIKEVICHADPDPKVTIEDFAKTSAFEGGHLFFEDKRYAPRPFNAEWYRKHTPQPGQYFVVYEDGYESVSPAEAFEAGYTMIHAPLPPR